MENLKPGKLIKIIRKFGAIDIISLHKNCPYCWQLARKSGNSVWMIDVAENDFGIYLGICKGCNNTYKVFYKNCVGFTETKNILEIELAK